MSPKNINRDEIVVKKQLIAKRKDIKNKLELLKQGQIMHENMFQPITKHLRKIESKLEPSKFMTKNNDDSKIFKDEPDKIKKESSVKFPYFNDSYTEFDAGADEKSNSMESEPLPSTSTPAEFKLTPKSVNFNTPLTAPRLKRRLSFSGATTSTATAAAASKTQPYNLRKLLVKNIQKEFDEEDIEKQREYEKKLHKTIHDRSITDYYEQYHTLPRKYIKKYVKDPHSVNSDGKFRVKFENDIEKFSIGNKRIHFDGPDLIISGKKFKGTKGLYGLLFNQNVPSIYTKEDARNYANILNRTNALRKNFNPNLNIITSRNSKFKKVIEPLLTREPSSEEEEETESDSDDNTTSIGKRQGMGILQRVSNKPIDYVFWDDPNELVVRLELLLASQAAGNTSHNNEINSIIEELREANIIV